MSVCIVCALSGGCVHEKMKDKSQRTDTRVHTHIQHAATPLSARTQRTRNYYDHLTTTTTTTTTMTRSSTTKSTMVEEAITQRDR